MYSTAKMVSYRLRNTRPMARTKTPTMKARAIMITIDIPETYKVFVKCNVSLK